MSPRESESGISRRAFVRMMAAAAGVLAGMRATGWADEAQGAMPMRALGRTGVRVSAIGLGGYHIGLPVESEAIALIRRAIDGGINFLDNSWDYHNGASELRMGKALRDGYREKVFLMTKIDGRTRQSAAEEIDESLRRLQVDHVDLMQFHEVARAEESEQIFGTDGAMVAMQAAQKAGKVRFIGFTGHSDPDVHLHMLKVAQQAGFRFDTVQLPLNVMDAHYRSFEHQVLPVLVKDEIGVLGMKSLGGGHILKSGTVTARECLRYALSLPASTVIAGMDSQATLDQALDVARTFQPLTAEERSAILERTKEAAATGEFEWFKSASHGDTTAWRKRSGIA